jgi:hypothetical protein
MEEQGLLQTEMRNSLDVLEKELCNLYENKQSIQTAVKRIGSLKELPRATDRPPSTTDKAPETYLEKITALISRAQALNDDYNFILVNLNRMV